MASSIFSSNPRWRRKPPRNVIHLVTERKNGAALKQNNTAAAVRHSTNRECGSMRGGYLVLNLRVVGSEHLTIALTTRFLMVRAGD
jgi:hypothetical protein